MCRSFDIFVLKTWSIVKGAIGKLSDKSGFPNECIVNNNTISDKLEISESFNRYFSSIGLKTSQNVLVTNMKFTDYLPNPTRHNMF